MKRIIHRYAVIVLALMSILVLMAGCSGNLRGSEILSKEGIKDRNIQAIEVTFFNRDNPLESPIASLKGDNEDQKAYMDEFEDIVNKAKGISLEEDEKFCPLTDSSHQIKMDFGDGVNLDFYYCEDNNWIIWSDLGDQEGQKVLKYHFLSPKDSLDEWLESIKPFATLDK